MSEGYKPMDGYRNVFEFPRRYEFPKTDRVNMRLTNQCNLACAPCFTSSTPDGAYGLPTQEVKANLDFLKEKGASRVHFTGGEPFVRIDTPRILAYAHDKGMIPSILSNGYRISKMPLDILGKLSLAQISVDGSKEMHDARRPTVNGRGSYEVAIAALYRLQEANVPTQISFTASLQNIGELEHVARVAKGVGAGLIVREQIPIGFAKNLDTIVHGTSQRIGQAVDVEKAKIEAAYGPIFVEDPFNFVPGQRKKIVVPTINPDGTIEGTLVNLADLRKAA